MKNHKKICLVTGAAGFVGSHLSEKLLTLGFLVRGIDCFLDNYPRNFKKDNIKDLLNDKNFHFADNDLLTVNLKSLTNGVDFIFHQAARPGVRQSWGRQFGTYVDNNILATQRLLEAVKELKIKKFIYASSSSVYGDAETFPTSEKLAPRPISPYGVTKLAAEHLCLLYAKNYAVPTVALRYFTVYGPRQRPDMAFHKFIKAAITGEKIEVYGDGRQTRDFTYIDDAIAANISAMESDVVGEVFNIGGGSRISIKEVLGIINELFGRKLKIAYLSEKKGDVRHTSADISKAKNILKYNPRVKIKEGLQKELIWLKELVRKR